jgi:hypothetical protein
MAEKLISDKTESYTSGLTRVIWWQKRKKKR